MPNADVTLKREQALKGYLPLRVVAFATGYALVTLKRWLYLAEGVVSSFTCDPSHTVRKTPFWFKDRGKPIRVVRAGSHVSGITAMQKGLFLKEKDPNRPYCKYEKVFAPHVFLHWGDVCLALGLRPEKQPEPAEILEAYRLKGKEQPFPMFRAPKSLPKDSGAYRHMQLVQNVVRIKGAVAVLSSSEKFIRRQSKLGTDIPVYSKPAVVVPVVPLNCKCGHPSAYHAGGTGGCSFAQGTCVECSCVLFVVPPAECPSPVPVGKGV